MDNVEPQKIRVVSTDAALAAELADLRADFVRLEEKVEKFDTRLQKHNERHYLLMGIIATVSFLAGLGMKVFQ